MNTAISELGKAGKVAKDTARSGRSGNPAAHSPIGGSRYGNWPPWNPWPQGLLMPLELIERHNRAERALPLAVLWRKMMQGAYNGEGDRGGARILSLRETSRLRSMPTFSILGEAVTSFFNGWHPDISWI